MPAALVWFDGLSRRNGASTIYGRGGRLGLNGFPLIHMDDFGVSYQVTGAVHFALNNNPRNSNIIGLLGDPVGIGSYHVLLQVDNLGFVKAYNGQSNILLGTSVSAIPNTSEYRGWEIRWVIDDTVGEFQVRIYDGGGATDYLTLSGKDTKHNGATVPGIAGFQGLCGGTTGDWYGHDGTDWWPTDDGCNFGALEAITEDDGVPIGAATTLDVLVDISGGTFPYHDGDATYSKIIPTGLPKRIVGEVTLPSDVDIRAVQPVATTRKTDAGVCQHTLLLQSPSGGTEDDNSGELFSAGTTYLARSRMYTEDPNNPGNPFTPGDTLAVGIERVA